MGIVADYGFVASCGGVEETLLEVVDILTRTNGIYTDQLGVQMVLGATSPLARGNHNINMDLALIVNADNTPSYEEGGPNYGPTSPGQRNTCEGAVNDYKTAFDAVDSNGEPIKVRVRSANVLLGRMNQWKTKYGNALCPNCGAWHLLTNCLPPPGVVGTATVGTMCDAKSLPVAFGGGDMPSGYGMSFYLTGQRCDDCIAAGLCGETGFPDCKYAVEVAVTGSESYLLEANSISDGSLTCDVDGNPFCWAASGISSWSHSSSWRTFAHEVGHNFGEGHTMGCGGLMDYGSDAQFCDTGLACSLIGAVTAARGVASNHRTGFTFDMCLQDLGAECSNGIVETGEECDDNNSVGGDGCAADCTIECGYQCEQDVSLTSTCQHSCGNGVVDFEFLEECDDTSSCCDQSTCKLVSGAYCTNPAENDCCDSDCKPMPATTTCELWGQCGPGGKCRQDIDRDSDGNDDEGDESLCGIIDNAAQDPTGTNDRSPARGYYWFGNWIKTSDGVTELSPPGCPIAAYAQIETDRGVIEERTWDRDRQCRQTCYYEDDDCAHDTPAKGCIDLSDFDTSFHLEDGTPCVYADPLDVAGRVCSDDDTVLDSAGYDCDQGYADGYAYRCGQYDSSTFTAADRCCNCGGGIYTAEPVCSNDESSGDSAGWTCSEGYDNAPVRCGHFDTSDFTAATQCCACKAAAADPDAFCKAGVCTPVDTHLCGNGVIDNANEECDDDSVCCTNDCRLQEGAQCSNPFDDSTNPSGNTCCSMSCAYVPVTESCDAGDGPASGRCVKGECDTMDCGRYQDMATHVYLFDSISCPAINCWSVCKHPVYEASSPYHCKIVFENYGREHLPDGAACSDFRGQAGACSDGYCEAFSDCVVPGIWTRVTGTFTLNGFDAGEYRDSDRTGFDEIVAQAIAGGSESGTNIVDHKFVSIDTVTYELMDDGTYDMHIHYIVAVPAQTMFHDYAGGDAASLGAIEADRVLAPLDAWVGPGAPSGAALRQILRDSLAGAPAGFTVTLGGGGSWVETHSVAGLGGGGSTPVFGGWSDWSACVTGTRTRTCTSPAGYCVGEAAEACGVTCASIPVPTHGSAGTCPVSGGLSSGEACLPDCDAGYTLSGFPAPWEPRTAKMSYNQAALEHQFDGYADASRFAQTFCLDGVVTAATCVPVESAGPCKCAEKGANYWLTGDTCSAFVGCQNCDGRSSGDWCYATGAGSGTDRCEELAGESGTLFSCNPSGGVITCDASAAPWMGEAGDCTDFLPSGETCQPSCGCGYTASPARCKNGVLFPAHCYDAELEVCEDTCEFSANGVCEDGGWTVADDGIEDDYLGEFPATNADTKDRTNNNKPRRSCVFGTDCHDCGPRKTMWKTIMRNGITELLTDGCMDSSGDAVTCGEGTETLTCHEYENQYAGESSQSRCPGLANNKLTLERTCAVDCAREACADADSDVFSCPSRTYAAFAAASCSGGACDAADFTASGACCTDIDAMLANCDDTNVASGTTNALGAGCAAYEEAPGLCTATESFDDADFVAADTCCACGGGTRDCAVAHGSKSACNQDDGFCSWAFDAENPSGVCVTATRQVDVQFTLAGLDYEYTNTHHADVAAAFAESVCSAIAITDVSCTCTLQWSSSSARRLSDGGHWTADVVVTTPAWKVTSAQAVITGVAPQAYVDVSQEAMMASSAFVREVTDAYAASDAATADPSAEEFEITDAKSTTLEVAPTVDDGSDGSGSGSSSTLAIALGVSAAVVALVAVALLGGFYAGKSSKDPVTSTTQGSGLSWAAPEKL